MFTWARGCSLFYLWGTAGIVVEEEVAMFFFIRCLVRNIFTRFGKKVRKQGGVCTGITQNIVNLLMSETSVTMPSNSVFILLLNQSSKGIEKIVESLETSEEQLNYVIDLPSECGLIKRGSRISI